MKPLALFAGLLALSMTTQSTFSQVPLLDRELFFGNPQISGGQLSPDGKYISFMKPHKGIMNVWIKELAEPFDKARPLSDSERPLYGFAWTDDGKYIVFVKDNAGDENMNLFAVDPTAAVAQGRDVPEARNLTPFEDVTAQIAHVSQNNPDLAWVGLNNRDKAWHDLYQIKISTGELTLIYKNEDRITGYEFDWDDHLRLLSRTDEAGTTTLLRKEGDKLEPIYESLVTENAAVVGWDKDNKNFYLATNKGDLDLSTLYLMNPETKELKLLESDPDKRVDFGSMHLDRNTREIISTSYTDDKTRHYWKNKTWAEHYEFLKQKFPGREVDFQSSTNDYSKSLIAVHGDKYASESWLYDANTRELTHQYTPRPELKEVEEHLASMQPVRYKSSDGLEIPAYLTLPVGVPAKNLPVVVLVHGGPKGPRDSWGFDPEAQFLANRGYAVLQPNFRASGGYGKKFMNAGDLQWGKLMQDDVTWGVKHLIEKGIADKNRVAIMGGSYGGYATLAGLAFTPDVYACGVDIVGPSNIFTLLESIPPYWEPALAFLYGMVGDPNTEQGKKLIRDASPLFSSNKINKPLLIIQGANDPRVKQAEADQIVIALRDRGHDVSYLLAEDEGHGFAKPVNRMAMYAETERFLAEKLGGRYDAVMPENVAKRLEELRVDISKVTYSPAGEAKVAASLPELKVKLAETTENWDIKLEVQGQSIPIKAKRTYVKESDNWIVTDTVTTPQGEVVSSGTYTADMKPLKITQSGSGPSISAEYKDGEVLLSVDGKASTLTYEGAFLPEGPGLEVILRSLPLDEGYELVANTVEPISKKIEQVRLKVEGVEDTEDGKRMKVSLTSIGNPAQKTTYWLNPETLATLRSERVIPQLGGAVMTRVLIP